MSDEWTILDMLLAYFEVEKHELEVIIELLGSEIKNIETNFQWGLYDNIIKHATPELNIIQLNDTSMDFAEIIRQVKILRKLN